MSAGKFAACWCVATALQIALGIALVTHYERKFYANYVKSRP